jgi:hypothetical protein
MTPNTTTEAGIIWFVDFERGLVTMQTLNGKSTVSIESIYNIQSWSKARQVPPENLSAEVGKTVVLKVVNHWLQRNGERVPIWETITGTLASFQTGYGFGRVVFNGESKMVELMNVLSVYVFEN